MDKKELFELALSAGALLGPGDMETLYDHAQQTIPEGGLALEVGTYTGGSALIIGTICKKKNARMICIDSYLYTSIGAAMKNTEGLPIDWILGDSVTVVKYLAHGIADFIFIDGEHMFPTVEKDIVNYWEILRVGGTYLLHDYTNPCDVGTCANAFAKIHNTQVEHLPDSIGRIIKYE